MTICREVKNNEYSLEAKIHYNKEGFSLIHCLFSLENYEKFQRGKPKSPLEKTEIQFHISNTCYD